MSKDKYKTIKPTGAWGDDLNILFIHGFMSSKESSAWKWLEDNYPNDKIH
jgi:hypothetical protein